MNGYELSRYWFDWAFENPDLINPNDTALYLWLIEKNNRSGWAEKFSVTASESMAACGFKTYPPYKKSFDRLIDFGFVLMVKKSVNQFQSNVIALTKNNKAIVKALDKAHLTHSTKHIDSSSESTFDINKQKTIKQETENKENLFESLWVGYPTKKNKQESLKKFLKLTDEEIEKVKIHLPIFSKVKEFEKYSHPHLTTYFNQKRFNDEIIGNKPDSEKKEYIIFRDQVNPTQRKILAEKFEAAKLAGSEGGYILTEIKRVWE